MNESRKLSEAIDSYDSLPQAFFELSDQISSQTVYEQALIEEGDSPDKNRRRECRDYSEVSLRVRKLAYFLKSVGIGQGDKVAIISTSRPEWMEADLAILALGGVSVSVYQSLPYDDIGYILFDSDSQVVFAENQEQVDKLTRLLGGPIPIPATEEREAMSAQIGLKAIIAIEDTEPNDLVYSYKEITGGEEVTTIGDYRVLKRDDLASLVYTSGTTGPPKGVMQTHGNHLANVRQAVACGLSKSDSRLFVFLPLAHAFAKLMGYLGFLTPATILFPAVHDRKSSKMDPDSVTKDMREVESTVTPVVPRLLEKMQAGVNAKSKGGGLKGALLSLTIGSAKKVYEAGESGNAAPLGAKLGYALTGGLRKKIKAQLFGDQIKYCISGGAKLNPQVARFFDSLGIEILEGYGLTETCVATNVNREGNKKIGTVGPVLDEDIEMKVTDDGEICFRGPNIALGYYKRQTATKASWDGEGWFHTGDLGEIDEDGFLSIVGRKKDILVTSYGKNIAPDEIEGKLKGSPHVSQAVMIGDGRPYCTALLTLDEEAIKNWAKKKGIEKTDLESLAQDDRVHSLLMKHVESVNQEVANYESVKKIKIISDDFTVENGLLTPTFKVKRNLVAKQYESEIEELYAE